MSRLMEIGGRWVGRVLTAGALAILVVAAPRPASAGDVPAAVAGKLEDGAAFSGLWSDASARKRVIVRFAMPALADAASFATPDAADAAQTAAIHAVQDQIIGRLLPPGHAAAAEDALGLKRMAFSPMFAMSATAATIEALAADPTVTRIQIDRLSKPALNNALPVIGMPAAYAAGATGTGFAVAILDTGSRRSHKFLNAHIIRAACFSTTDGNQGATSLCPGGANATTIDSSGGCPANLDGCEHGSHVAGIAAGLNPNVQAGEPSNGVARDGRLISIQVFTRIAQAQCGAGATTDCTSSFGSDQILALEHVFSLRNTLNIAAANMSLGSDNGFAAACDNDPLKPIIDQLRTANIATVIAAGNESRDAAVGSPSCISSAIAVAATDNNDVRAPFSNWGNLIDVVAPGVDIISSVNTSDTAFAPSSGTSMASPMVAGVFAAIRTVRPTATVTQIENALKTTGLGILAAGVTKPRIRVPEAINALPAVAPIIVAAVTPVSRATSIGGTVTAFATVINAGTTTATGCNIALPGNAVGVNFTYQTRNFNTNALGPINTPVDIPGGNTRQDFLMAFNPTQGGSGNLALIFDCTNTAPAASVVGLNTFLLTAQNPAPADLISIAVTATNDGIANVPLGGTGFAALAGNNIGAATTLTATVESAPFGGGGTALPATLTLCRTTGGTCVAPPTPSVTFAAASNTIVTFTAFIASNGTAIPFDPAARRMFVNFTQGGIPVGSASVAVRTTTPDAAVAAAQ